MAKDCRKRECRPEWCAGLELRLLEDGQFHENQRVGLARTCREFPGRLGFASEDQGAFQVKGGFGADMFDAIFPLRSQLVEAQAIEFRLYQIA